MLADVEQSRTALRQAAASGFDWALGGRCGTVFARQAVELGIEIGLFAVDEFFGLCEFLEIKVRLVQLWPQFGGVGPDEEGDQ